MTSPMPASDRAAIDDDLRCLGWTMLTAKVRAARNQFAVTRRRSPVGSSLRVCLLVPFIIGFTSLLMIGFASALSLVDDAQTATTLLAIVVAVGMISAFIGSSTTALQALYLSDDIPFLITLPIPLRVLFGTKFFEASFGTAPSCMLMVAAVGGYGLAYSGGFLFYLAGLAVILIACALATSVSVLVVSLVTRFIPPRRARAFLLTISLAVTLVTFLGWRLLLPQPDKINDLVEGNRFARMWNALGLTPAGWSATALTNAAERDLIPFVLVLLLLAITAIVTISASFRVFQRTFIRGLAQTRSVQTMHPNESITIWLERTARLLPGSIRGVVLKEWLVLTRDLRRLSGAIWPVGVVIMYSLLLSRGDQNAFGSGSLQFWSRNGTLALLPWGLSLGISVYAYGSEGRNIQLLRTLPLSARSIFAAKVIAALLPVTLISMLAAVTSLWLRQAPIAQSLQLIGLLIWMITGYVLIDTSAAALSPNFEASQIQRTIGLPGRIFSFAVGAAFSLATIVGMSRLIFFTASEPSGLSDLLHTHVLGIEPLGWPLVVVAAVAAAGVLALCARLAINQTASLLSSPV